MEILFGILSLFLPVDRLKRIWNFIHFRRGYLTQQEWYEYCLLHILKQGKKNYEQLFQQTITLCADERALYSTVPEKDPYEYTFISTILHSLKNRRCVTQNGDYVTISETGKKLYEHLNNFKHTFKGQ